MIFLHLSIFEIITSFIKFFTALFDFLFRYVSREIIPRTNRKFENLIIGIKVLRIENNYSIIGNKLISRLEGDKRLGLNFYTRTLIRESPSATL